MQDEPGVLCKAGENTQLMELARLRQLSELDRHGQIAEHSYLGEQPLRDLLIKADKITFLHLQC